MKRPSPEMDDSSDESLACAPEESTLTRLVFSCATTRVTGRSRRSAKRDERVVRGRVMSCAHRLREREGPRPPLPTHLRLPRLACRGVVLYASRAEEHLRRSRTSSPDEATRGDREVLKILTGGVKGALAFDFEA